MNDIDSFILRRRELPLDNPLSELAEQNGRLISELAEASAILEDIATLATQIHAPFAARPRDPLKSTNISSFPNELLARIFEEAMSETIGFTAVSKTLSHVCRDWRLVALDLPNLWAEVDLGQCQEECLTFLKRSKNVPLMVNIETFANNIGEFLDAVVPHAERWGRLRVLFEDEGNFLSIVDAQYSTLDVPLLTDLDVNYPFDDTDDLIEELGEEITVFFKNWNMPNLRSLKASGCLSPY